MHRTSDPIGLAWLVTGRWTTLAAAAGAVVAGRSALDTALPVVPVTAIFATILASNLWLWWRVRSGRATVTAIAGALLCVDVVLLSWLLLRSGGVLNPASVFYLVQIVLAALVLGRTWAWVVTALSVAGYAGLFLAPVEDLRAAQTMHPEIALHMRGMWLAFALTALVIAAMVTRLATAVERRDRSLAELREGSARSARVAGLATVVAGAAHELGTPLGTIAVAARELERAIEARGADAALAPLAHDARLIRAEIDRSRAILDQMAGQIAEPTGETPLAVTPGQVLAATAARLNGVDRDRIATSGALDQPVVWPAGVVAQALGNLVRNALQASPAADGVRVDVSVRPDSRVAIAVIDRGSGIGPQDLARVGEPFFTTKPVGTGMGLGVFVARAAIEQLGGELVISSRRGEGTTATIVLPRDVMQVGGGRDG